MGCDFDLARGQWAEEDNEELRNFLTKDEIKIQELEEENTNLKQSVEWYKNREKELLKQIKKMKCCGNCNKNEKMLNSDTCIDCKNYSSWELKENDL